MVLSLICIILVIGKLFLRYLKTFLSSRCSFLEWFCYWVGTLFYSAEILKKIGSVMLIKSLYLTVNCFHVFSAGHVKIHLGCMLRASHCEGRQLNSFWAVLYRDRGSWIFQIKTTNKILIYGPVSTQ